MILVSIQKVGNNSRPFMFMIMNRNIKIYSDLKINRILMKNNMYIRLIYTKLILIYIISIVAFVGIYSKVLLAINIYLTYTMFFLVINNGNKITINRKIISILSPYILFVTLSFINLYQYYARYAITNIALYFTFGVIFYSISIIKMRSYHIHILATISWLYLLLLLIFQTTQNLTLNPNSIGVLSLILCYFPLLRIFTEQQPRYSKIVKISIVCMLTSYIIYNSGSRSIMISIVFIILTCFMWNLISKSKVAFSVYFIAIIIIILSYTYIYSQLPAIIGDSKYVQDIVLKYTGKSLFSGRESMWDMLFETIKMKPIFGHGAGKLASEITGRNLSAHNLYLEILLRFGLMGLLFFVYFLFKVWNIFWEGRHDCRVILSACFFVGIITHQMNETMLLQGSASLNFPIWILLSIGVNFSLISKKRKEHNWRQ